jgi:hypothetical protein
LLRTVKRELNGELPVLAFAGAPFTVAAYCIGTGKHVDQTRHQTRESENHRSLPLSEHLFGRPPELYLMALRGPAGAGSV